MSLNRVSTFPGEDQKTREHSQTQQASFPVAAAEVAQQAIQSREAAEQK
jgi:hypothetical protein